MAVLVGGRLLKSGTGSFKLNPQLERLLQSSMSVLNASRKIRGDRVSLWKYSTPDPEAGGVPPFGFD